MVKVSHVTATAKVQTPPVFGTEGHTVMETYTYSHFPSEVLTVHLALYSNVSNAQISENDWCQLRPYLEKVENEKGKP